MRPIIVDANIVFAAFLRDGSTREVILDRGLDLRTPPWLWEEVAARHDWMRERTGLPAAALDELLLQVRSRIADVPAPAIEAQREEALRRVGRACRPDAPYVAAALAVGGSLWTHDAVLRKACGVPVVTTADLLAK